MVLYSFDLFLLINRDILRTLAQIGLQLSFQESIKKGFNKSNTCEFILENVRGLFINYNIMYCWEIHLIVYKPG